MRFLFVDRILELSAGEYARGIKHITADDAYLYRDERGHVVFPPSLIGETLGQLAAWNVMLTHNFNMRPVAGVVASAQVYRSAYVGETLVLESYIDALDDTAVQYHSTASIGNEPVFRIEGAIGPLLPMADFIEAKEVRQQFAEINRPGTWPPAIKEQQGSNRLANELLLSHRYMTFDRVLECNPGQSLIAEKRITRSAPWFPDHFPLKPVLPLTVLLECKIHLAKLFLTQMAFPQPLQVVELRKIKMSEFVYPGDILTCYLNIKKQEDAELVLNFRSEVEGKRVCVLDMVLAAKGKENA